MRWKRRKMKRKKTREKEAFEEQGYVKQILDGEGGKKKGKDLEEERCRRATRRRVI